MTDEPQRACPTCDTVLTRRKGEAWSNFALRVYCDRRCFTKALRTKLHNRRTGAVRK